MELVFIRHAQPEWVREGVSLLDPPLSDRGRQQAARLGELARTWKKPAQVLVSPLRRARETAEPILSALGESAHVTPWLEEIRLPDEWDGAPADRVSELLRAARTRTIAEWWDGIPGGETFRDFHERVTTNLTSALGDHGATPSTSHNELRVWNVRERERTMVFVGHGGTNAVAVGHLLGIEPVPWAWERFVMLHASITRLKASPLLGGFIFGLREHSDTAHMPRDLCSR
jgi:broad specificity phosphatase PhoE